MPKTKTAKKALRQNIRRKGRNVIRRKELKEVLKKFGKLIAENKKGEASKLLPQVYKKLDKFAKTDPMKRGRVNRLKSRLSKKVGSL